MAVTQTLTLTEVADSMSIADNTSKVKIVWQSTQSGESRNLNTRTAKYWISINGGTEEEISVSYTLPQNTTKTIVSKTITVPHKSDGSGTVKVRTWMDTRISVGVVELNKQINLTTIPRASSLDSLSCATAYFTGTLTYKYTPKSAAFYNRCNISLNLNGEYIAVKTINLGTKSASQKTATVTLSSGELSTIYKKLTHDNDGTLRFTFRTYSDSGYSNQIGDADYKELKLGIPNDINTRPFVSMSLAPVGSLPAAFEGLYVQGKTKVKATLSGDGKYDAEIISYSVNVVGTTYDSGDKYTSGYLSKYGEIEVTGRAIDSRGFPGTTVKKITVIAYSKPKLLDVEASRCDKDGNLADDGTHLKIKAKRSYSYVKSDGVQKNFCQIRYRYKVASASDYGDWVTILAKNSLGSDQVETGALLGGTLAIDTTYQVQVQAIDDIGDFANTYINVPTDTVHNHKTKNGWGMGKYCEHDKAIDSGWDLYMNGNKATGFPTPTDSSDAVPKSYVDVLLNNYTLLGTYSRKDTSTTTAENYTLTLSEKLSNFVMVFVAVRTGSYVMGSSIIPCSFFKTGVQVELNCVNDVNVGYYGNTQYVSDTSVKGKISGGTKGFEVYGVGRIA